MNTKETETKHSDTAVDLFETHTGGNHNVGTWTSKAIIEFAETYHAYKSRLAPLPPTTEEVSPEQKLLSYFEQQLRLQRSSEIKYTGEEAYWDAVDVCKNILKNKPAEEVKTADYFGKKTCDVNDVGFDTDSPHYANNVFMRNADVWTDEHDWVMTKERFIKVFEFLKAQ